jgi:hypothetical protein
LQFMVCAPISKTRLLIDAYHGQGVGLGAALECL